MEDDDKYTKDGSVDIHNKPAIKNKTGNWKACPYILGNECCKRLAYYGMSTNLVNYLKDKLGLPNAMANNNVANWSRTLHNPTDWSLYSRCLLGKILDNYQFRDHREKA
eukprot:TRINITY_DN5107_c0_g1_i7.p1 TRINITY_DN5107_c0_g1~~TRINITY_DN5107_c0_g1_i7.p1  ORF type:complete len:109 (+),score=10.56 TRINITY_DN5107_c0_g1_i7:149-475(+)